MDDALQSVNEFLFVCLLGVIQHHEKVIAVARHFCQTAPRQVERFRAPGEPASDKAARQTDDLPELLGPEKLKSAVSRSSGPRSWSADRRMLT